MGVDHHRPAQPRLTVHRRQFAVVFLVFGTSLIQASDQQATTDTKVLLAGGSAWPNSTYIFQDGRFIVPGATEAYIYHQANNSWTSATDFSNNPSGRLDFKMLKLANGEILAAGGDLYLQNSFWAQSIFPDLNLAESTSETFDVAANLWTFPANMSEARFEHQMVELPDGRVLVVGGKYHFLDELGGWLNSTEIYDPESGEWSDGPGYAGQYQERRDFQLQSLQNGSVLLCGGKGVYASSDMINATVAMLDPSLERWTWTANMSIAVFQHRTAILPSGKVIAVGGYSGNVQDDLFPLEIPFLLDRDAGYTVQNATQLFDLVTETWKLGGTMLRGRADFALVTLQDGRAMACGGYASLPRPARPGSILITSEHWLLSCEVFDETSGEWEALEDLPFDRDTNNINLLLLPDGNVFATGTPNSVVGNYTITRQTLVSAIYDTKEDTWEVTSAFPGRTHSGYQLVVL